MTFKANVFKINIIIFLLINSACSTYYKKKINQDGYYEKRVNDREFKVGFEGNNYTSDEVLTRFFMRRCAEIALKYNYTYFNIIEKNIKTKSSIVNSGGYPMTKARLTALSYSGRSDDYPTIQKTIKNHVIEGVIALFHENEKSNNAFRADEILKKLSK